MRPGPGRNWPNGGRVAAGLRSPRLCRWDSIAPRRSWSRSPTAVPELDGIVFDTPRSWVQGSRGGRGRPRPRFRLFRTVHPRTLTERGEGGSRRRNSGAAACSSAARRHPCAAAGGRRTGAGARKPGVTRATRQCHRTHRQVARRPSRGAGARISSNGATATKLGVFPIRGATVGASARTSSRPTAHVHVPRRRRPR